jgi:dCTP deaminase
MIKSDRWIKDNGDRILRPFIPSQIKEITAYAAGGDAGTYRCISFGTSSFGYDIRLATDGFRVFSPIGATEIDPKNFDSKSLTAPVLYTDPNGASYYRIPPHGYALGVSVEQFQIPDNVLAICLGKSTYARCGLIVNTTPLEPGWRGRLVLELANSANLPLRVYVDEGIAQVLFFESDESCEVSYADRTGKYQDQTGITMAKV